MDASALLAVLQARIMAPEDVHTNLLMGLRWIHFLAGITWVGLLYWFNLVNVPFMKEADAAIKPAIMRGVLLRTLWWFRWGAVVTVLAGVVYWSLIISTDVRNARAAGEMASSATAMSTFFIIWTVVWALQAAVIMPAQGFLNKGEIVAVWVAISSIAGSWLFLTFNTHGWESNRMLAIGIGGGLGWMMMLNVWGIIWRVQKKIISGTLAGTPPANAAKLARQGFVASRVNFALSLPMLFFMAAASHYPMFG